MFRMARKHSADKMEWEDRGVILVVLLFLLAVIVFVETA
jgi:hypothetical protein